MNLPINDEIIKEKYTNSQKSPHNLSLVSNEQVIHRYLFLDNSAMFAVGRRLSSNNCTHTFFI